MRKLVVVLAILVVVIAFSESSQEPMVKKTTENNNIGSSLTETEKDRLFEVEAVKTKLETTAHASMSKISPSKEKWSEGETLETTPKERMDADVIKDRHLSTIASRSYPKNQRKFLDALDTYQEEKPSAEHLFIENADGVIIESDVTIAEGAAAIYRYFKEDGINAPLYNYGKIFAIVSRELRLDWRLLPAIAMQESTGGKFLFRPYNAFGFGRHDFESHEEAIRTVGKGLAGILSPNYRKWYGGKDIREKLGTYNSVNPTYIEEVMWIMRAISRAHERNKAESQ